MNIDTTDLTLSQHTLIAYHVNCIDGFTAYWVVAKALNMKEEFQDGLAMNYTEESHLDLITALATDKYKDLIIVDYSIPVSLISDISLGYPELTITILDHHKTAFEDYVGVDNLDVFDPDGKLKSDAYWSGKINNAKILLDNARSGASLAWKHFNPGLKHYPWLIKYVADYDLWKFHYGDETKWINKVLKKEEKTLDIWESLYSMLENEHNSRQLLQEGKLLQDLHMKEVEEIAKQAVEIELDLADISIKGLVVECPYEFVSDVGHTLAEKCNTFGLMYNIDLKKNQVTFSLRSQQNFDVSTLARFYGGGGHKASAGFVHEFITPVVDLNL